MRANRLNNNLGIVLHKERCNNYIGSEERFIILALLDDGQYATWEANEYLDTYNGHYFEASYHGLTQATNDFITRFNK